MRCRVRPGTNSATSNRQELFNGEKGSNCGNTRARREQVGGQQVGRTMIRAGGREVGRAKNRAKSGVTGVDAGRLVRGEAGWPGGRAWNPRFGFRGLALFCSSPRCPIAICSQWPGERAAV